MSRDELVGVMSLVGGVGLFSTVEVTGKIIGFRVDPFVLVFIRFFFTGCVLLAVSVPIARLRLEPLGIRDYGIFCLNGFIGVTCALSLFHTALLVLEKAASSAVVFSANPVFVMILARFVNRETWNTRKWIAVLLGVGGISCFALESGEFAVDSILGLGLMVSSAFFFALSICIVKRVMARYGATLLMGFSSLFGSLLLFPLVVFRGMRYGLGGLSQAWIPVLYITLMGTTLAYILYYFGLLNTPVQRGSMTFFLKPVMASVLAVIALGETINRYMLVGTVLILFGLFVVMVTRKRNIVSMP